MKQTLRYCHMLLATICLAAVFAHVAPASAQNEDFTPYKGICWGLFFADDAETIMAPIVPVEYVRPSWDKYILLDFVGCGKDLIVNITGEDVNPGYYMIELEMDGGLYDDYGYFYPPFTDGAYKYTIAAPYDQHMGPILQPYSYYYPELEYIGFFYVRYPETAFGYFDIKTQEDYYDDVPRSELTPEEIEEFCGETGISALPETPLKGTYYNLQGRKTGAKTQGIVIEGGRKVLR